VAPTESTIWPRLSAPADRDPRVPRGITGDLAGSVDVKPVVRHNLTNVLITGLASGRAQVTSYFTVLTHVGLDHFGRHRDTVVPNWAAPDPAMARTPPGWVTGARPSGDRPAEHRRPSDAGAWQGGRRGQHF